MLSPFRAGHPAWSLLGRFYRGSIVRIIGIILFLDYGYHPAQSTAVAEPVAAPLLKEHAMKIEGTVALVTGSNRGIGKSFVEALLARGAAKVYAGARNPASVGFDDPRVVPVKLDVTDEAEVATLATELGDVQLVVNNAGIGRPAFPLDATLDNARDELATNYLALVSTTQAFAPVLAGNGGGAFVNVLSVVSWVASPILSTYAASKAAAWSYTNGARVQLKGQGTQVVGVHVGFVDTDLTAGFEGDKVTPQSVAVSALDTLEAGGVEAIVDDWSVAVKAGLSDDQNTLYPEVQARFEEQIAASSAA
jgi:NAD(P)-dependent dehydrogenase (short-subunit alcohol dehydrogenase family)